MVIILGVIPVFTPLDIPSIPQPKVQIEGKIETWWYKEVRSDWVAVEDCWSNTKVPSEWWSIESSIRPMLENVRTLGLVSSDLDWTYNGFCLRIQGLQDSVLEHRNTYIDKLMTGDLQRTHRDISTLDIIHFGWMYNQKDVPNMYRQKRIWRSFWEDASQHTVYISSAPLSLDTRWSKPNVWLPIVDRPDIKKDVHLEPCNLQIRPEFPQVAVSIQASYTDLSTSELRIISSILGDGVRSRLSHKLREEMGLVYSIGTRFTGNAIQIDYTVDPTQLVDSLAAIQTVLLNFSRSGANPKELDTARSMFLLRQYEILEDPATFVRMAGRFNNPNGWDNYIDRTIDVFETGRLIGLTTQYPYLRVWLTGPLNHPEVLTTDVSQVSDLCSVVQADRY